MKIIHFIAGIDKTGGGTSEYMRLLSAELKNHVELIIATGKSANPVKIEGVNTFFFDVRPIRWYTMLKEFESFLQKERPDLIHINGIWSPQNWGFQKVAHRLGIKVIVSPHGMLEPWILAQNPLKKRIGLLLYQRKAIEQATCIHATAIMEAKNIEALGFTPPIHIIANGINLDDVKHIKTEYGSRKMVFLSRIHPKKGIELLLEAWRNCNTLGWELEIAGNGDENYIASLQVKAKDLNNVRFVGAQYGDDKWKFLQSADVMILPTHSENFGIVVAEALAVGVPVITTKGTPWEDLELHQCGWWINLSLPELEQTITKVIQISVSDLKTMGIQGRNLVKKKYEMKAITRKFVEMYKKVLN